MATFGDMSYYLGQKYAILAQQAAAQNKSGDAALMNADTNKTAVAASSALDRARASVIPQQSVAEIALQKAQTGLVGQQSQWFGPTAQANIAESAARTEGIGVSTEAERRLTEAQLDGINATPQIDFMKFANDIVNNTGIRGAVGAPSPLASSVAAPSLSRALAAPVRRATPIAMPKVYDDPRLTDEKGVRVFRGGY